MCQRICVNHLCQSMSIYLQCGFARKYIKICVNPCQSVSIVGDPFQKILTQLDLLATYVLYLLPIQDIVAGKTTSLCMNAICHL